MQSCQNEIYLKVHTLILKIYNILLGIFIISYAPFQRGFLKSINSCPVHVESDHRVHSLLERLTLQVV